MRLTKDPLEIAQGNHRRPTFLVAIPTFGFVPIEFVVGFARMQLPVNAVCESLIVKNMEIGVARNYVAEQALRLSSNPEYIFFLGDDMIVSWNSLIILYEAMSTGKWDILCGLYYMKGEPPVSIMGRKDTVGKLVPYTHYIPGEIVNVDWTGLDFTLIKTDVFKKLSSPYFKTGPSVFVKDGKFTDDKPITEDSVGIVSHTEDIWFYDKCIEAGLKIGVHTGVRIAHLNTKTGEVF